MKILIWHHGVAVLAQDSFTDANGTSLSSHRMDVGGGWTQQASAGTAGVIQGNQALLGQNGASGNVIYTTPTSYANVTLAVTIDLPSAGNNSLSDAGLVFRFQDANNYSFVTVGSGGMAVYEKSGGSFTQRAAAGFTVSLDTNYTIVAVVSGATVRASVNGGNVLTYGSLAVNPTGTTHGLRYNGGATNSFGFFENFEATNP
jgi:hypothetical protein